MEVKRLREWRRKTAYPTNTLKASNKTAARPIPITEVEVQGTTRIARSMSITAKRRRTQRKRVRRNSLFSGSLPYSLIPAG